MLVQSHEISMPQDDRKIPDSILCLTIQMLRQVTQGIHRNVTPPG